MREWSSSCESILQANLINIVFFLACFACFEPPKKPNCLLSNQKPHTCPVDHKDPLLGLVFQAYNCLSTFSSPVDDLTADMSKVFF